MGRVRKLVNLVTEDLHSKLTINNHKIPDSGVCVSVC